MRIILEGLRKQYELCVSAIGRSLFVWIHPTPRRRQEYWAYSSKDLKGERGLRFNPSLLDMEHWRKDLTAAWL